MLKSTDIISGQKKSYKTLKPFPNETKNTASIEMPLAISLTSTNLQLSCQASANDILGMPKLSAQKI